MSELRIFLFGYPRVECDGDDVPIRRRKALALLSYLAATSASHSRDTLATLLWPEYAASRAFAFLRNALWILNATPVSEWLVSTRHTIGLRLDANLWTDVTAFRQAHARCTDDDRDACVNCLAGAVNLFSGEFLEGFSIEDSEPFEDWQYSEANALRQELAASLERLSQAYEERGKLDEAIQLVHRWIEVQPLNEIVHRRAMALYARAGQRADALAQLDVCEQTLQRELGLPPSEETMLLAKQIRRGEIAPLRRRKDAKAVPVRLPHYRTPLVGREKELSRAAALLNDESCRLLTITGPGGTGKTRLAVAAAAQCAPSFPDGVAFVPLVSTPSSSRVPLEIADVLATYAASDDVDQEVGSSTPGAFSDLLLARLKPTKLLLVLDNMEHLLADLRWVDTLLSSSPGITLLVTSRQQLDLQDEWVLQIEGLPFPVGPAPTAELPTYDAVSLFLQSARRANASFSPTEEDWQAISRTVSLLQGLPLGIELAAAWARTMSCQTIADEIGSSLDFLSTTMRDVPKRHHSLRAVFEQSWSLLSREARVIYRKLAVFREGFTLDAAAKVAGATLPVLASLAARSLLRRTAPDRFDMLEVLRQYAEERLLALPDEHEKLRELHATTYLSLVAEQEQALKGRDQKEACERVLADIDNVRAAWRWACENGQIDLLGRAALGLFLYCDMRNTFDEAVDLFRDAAASVQDRPDAKPLRGLLKGLEAWFSRMRRGSNYAEPLFAESLHILDEEGMSRELALVNLLRCFAGIGAPEDRRARLTQSRTYFEEIGAAWEEAEALEALAWVAIEVDRETALQHARRSVAIHEQLADPWGIAMARCTLGCLYTMAEEYEAARIQLEASLSLRQENDLDPLGAMQCIIELGYLSVQAGDWIKASERYAEALEIAEEKRAKWAQASIHEWLGSVSQKCGNRGQAAHHAKAAQSIYRSFTRPAEVARCQALIDSLDASPSDADDSGEAVPSDPASRRVHRPRDIEGSNP